MVLFNHTTRELTAKIVYYGPGLSGKTTNLRALHERLDPASTGRLLSLATAQDRTIYFDLLPVELGNIKGYAVRFQLCTVPGQVFYNETRKLVLKGADGIVFVVDSQWSMLSHNLESYQNLRDNLREMGVAPDSIPVVVQFNKRDLPGILSVEALQESLGFRELPFVEAVAPDGRGVVETFKLASKLTFIDLMRRLQRPTSLAVLRAEATATGRGEIAQPVPPDATPAPSAPPPPPPEAAPVLVQPPPVESPFEMSDELPAPPVDEIFGIPLRDPDAPGPEELILPEPPPPTEEFETAAGPDDLDDTAPGGPAPVEVSGPFQASAGEETRGAAENEEPLDAAPSPELAPPPEAPATAPVETATELPAEAQATAPVETAAEPPAGASVTASIETAAEPPPGTLLGAGPAMPAFPAPEAAAPDAPASLLAAVAPGEFPEPYEALERRIEELEARLERVLTALRGALGDPPGGAGAARTRPSPGNPEDPGI